MHKDQVPVESEWVWNPENAALNGVQVLVDPSLAEAPDGWTEALFFPEGGAVYGYAQELAASARKKGSNAIELELSVGSWEHYYGVRLELVRDGRGAYGWADGWLITDEPRMERMDAIRGRVWLSDTDWQSSVYVAFDLYAECGESMCTRGAGRVLL